MAHAKITELHPETFYNLTKLTSLYIWHTPITELPPGIFSGLENLLFLDLRFTNIRRLNSNSFGRLEKFYTFDIQSSGLDEIQPGFFDNFPSLNNFYASNNTCINATLSEPHSINFEENKILNQCFANWYVPREETTPSGSGRKVVNLILSISLMLSGFLYDKFVN
jgi:Leucine-rich repeat (LRR) protein